MELKTIKNKTLGQQSDEANSFAIKKLRQTNRPLHYSHGLFTWSKFKMNLAEIHKLEVLWIRLNCWLWPSTLKKIVNFSRRTLQAIGPERASEKITCACSEEDYVTVWNCRRLTRCKIKIKWLDLGAWKAKTTQLRLRLSLKRIQRDKRINEKEGNHIIGDP